LRPREPFTYFIDRSLGRRDVPDALRGALNAGESLTIHDDILAPDTDDCEWLKRAADSGWIIVSKDSRIRRNPLELEALRNSGAAAFMLANASLSGPQQGLALVAALPRIRTVVRRFDVAIIASVNIDGAVTVIWAGGEPLPKPKVFKK
jgi:hypothetical protein